MSANLLFIYGPSGAGKTRLLQMIEESCGEQSIMRVGCEELAADMAACCRDGNVNDFLKKYSLVKNLLLDNLWILRRRKAVAEQIRRLIAARVATANLTILASDISYEDVTDVLPAIGNSLKEHDVVQLRLGPGRPATKPSLEDLTRGFEEDAI